MRRHVDQLRIRQLQALPRLQAQAFANARAGDFDLLIRMFWMGGIHSLTSSEARVIADILAGKSGAKDHVLASSSRTFPEAEINFGRLVVYAGQVRTLLRQHYGQRKGLLSGPSTSLANRRSGTAATSMNFGTGF